MSILNPDTSPDSIDSFSGLMEGCEGQTLEEVNKFLGLLDEVSSLNNGTILSSGDTQQIKSVVGFVYNVYDGQVRESEKLTNGGKTPVFLHKIRAASFSLQGFLILHKSLKSGEQDIFKGIKDEFLKKALVVYQECSKDSGPGILRDHILYRIAHDVPEDGRGTLVPPENMLDSLLKKKYNESILTNKRTKLNETHENELVENINVMQTTPYFMEFKEKYPNLMPHLNRFLEYGDVQKDGTTTITLENLHGSGLHGTYQDIFVADGIVYEEKHGVKRSERNPSTGRGIERVRICTDVSIALYYIYLREQGIDAPSASWVINRVAKVTTVKYGTISLTDEQSLNDQIKSNPGMMLGKLGDVLDNLRSLGSDPDMLNSGYLTYKKDVRFALEQNEWYPSLYELLHDKIPPSQVDKWKKKKSEYEFSSLPRSDDTSKKYLKKIKKYEGYLASINVQGYGWIEKFIPHLYEVMGMKEFYDTDSNLIKINIDILGLQEKKNSIEKDEGNILVGSLIGGFEKNPDGLDKDLFTYIRKKGLNELQRPLSRQDEVKSQDKKYGVDLFPSITLLDMYTSSGWTKTMLTEFLTSVHGVTISTNENFHIKEGLPIINNLFEKAFDTYLYELGAHRRLPKQFQSKRLQGSFKHEGKPKFRGFTSFDDIWQFLNGNDEINNAPIMQRIRCSILKLAYVEGVVAQSAPSLDQNKEFFNFIEKGFIPFLRVVPEDKQAEFEKLVEKFSKTTNKTVDEYEKFNEFFSSYMFRLQMPAGVEDDMFLGSENIARIELRRKLDKEQVRKLISDSKYNMLSALQDTFGIRIHVYGQDQGLKIAHFLWEHIYQKQTEFGNKNFLTDLEKFKLVYGTGSGLDIEFLNMVQKSIPEPSDGNKNLTSKHSSSRFQGTDLTGNVGLSRNMETQIVYYGNTNETKGTSHRGIYEAKKNIRNMMRLEGYVSKQYMRSMLREKIRKYKYDLYPFGGGDEEKAVNYFFDAIVRESNLFSKLSTYVNGVRKTYYVLTERRQELDFWYLLPAGSDWEIQIGGKRKKIDGNRYMSWRKKHRELNRYIESKLVEITSLLDRTNSTQRTIYADLMATKNELQVLLESDDPNNNINRLEVVHKTMIRNVNLLQPVLAKAS